MARDTRIEWGVPDSVPLAAGLGERDSLLGRATQAILDVEFAGGELASLIALRVELVNAVAASRRWFERVAGTRLHIL